jgi:hypothetical protein
MQPIPGSLMVCTLTGPVENRAPLVGVSMLRMTCRYGDQIPTSTSWHHGWSSKENTGAILVKELQINAMVLRVYSQLKVAATITDEQSNHTGNRDPMVCNPVSYSSCAWTAFILIFLGYSSLSPCNCWGKILTLWRLKFTFYLYTHSARTIEHGKGPFEIPIPLCRRTIKVFLVRNIKNINTRGRQNVELLVLNLAVYRTYWTLGCAFQSNCS